MVVAMVVTVFVVAAIFTETTIAPLVHAANLALAALFLFELCGSRGCFCSCCR
jgi:hypothetical protein